jgi:hypothetical protein
VGGTREADAGSTRVGRASDFILKGGDVRHTLVATEFGRLCLLDCLDAQVCVWGGGGEGLCVCLGRGGVSGGVLNCAVFVLLTSSMHRYAIS